MKYFLDTEFIESGPNEPIYLISIGIVCEDGREFYKQNLDCKLHLANDWVKENVISNLINPPYLGNDGFYHIAGVVKTPNEMLTDWSNWASLEYIKKFIMDFIGNDPNPEFYAYYADYDWVVFCQIFGTMIDLPKGKMKCTNNCKGFSTQYKLDETSNIERYICIHCDGLIIEIGKFPMFCNDLKQLCNMLGNPTLPDQSRMMFCSSCNKIFIHDGSTFSSHCGTARSIKLLIEHNALNDAKWNFEVYKFLLEIAKPYIEIGLKI